VLKSHRLERRATGQTWESALAEEAELNGLGLQVKGQGSGDLEPEKPWTEPSQLQVVGRRFYELIWVTVIVLEVEHNRPWSEKRYIIN